MKRWFGLCLGILLLLGATACGNKAPTWQEQYDLGIRYLNDGDYEEAVIAFGKFKLNLGTREMFREDEPMPLTSGEFAVLKALVSQPREPLSRDKLMNLARGREYSAMERSIDVQISRLRRMVEEDPAHPRYIQTVWGVGYVFVPDGTS